MDIDELMAREDAIERLVEQGYQPGDAARLHDAQAGQPVPGCASAEPASVEISPEELGELEG